MARMAPSGQESADQPWGCRITSRMTSSKSVTEQLEGRCVIGRAPSGHEADKQLAASNKAERARCHLVGLFSLG